MPIELEDRRLARVVARCQELPGQELFQYVDDDGAVQDVDSADVNEYLREIAGEEFTAKDFRTWAGTVLAALALQEFETFDSQTQAKKNVVSAIERVAERLGNTPSVCRKCYVHPVILDAYLDGSMIDALQRRAKQEMEESLADLRPEEAAVMALLQNRLARRARRERSNTIGSLAAIAFIAPQAGRRNPLGRSGWSVTRLIENGACGRSRVSR